MKTIPLTKGHYAIVDDEDYAGIAAFSWYSNENGGIVYAYRKTYEQRPHIVSMPMHRQILRLKKGQIVDHIDFNGLNNQKSNLRVCTVSQNQFHRRLQPNSSGLKGVHWSKKQRKWVTNFTENGRSYYVGAFTDRKAAGRAYDAEAIRCIPEFAATNASLGLL